MVDEGFGFTRAFRDGEGLGEELFDEEEVRGCGEGGVEGEDRARAAEAIAGEVEFGHCVYCSRISIGQGKIVRPKRTVL